MPIYDFKCVSDICNYKFDSYVPRWDSPRPKCIICGSSTEKLLSRNTRIDMNGICTATDRERADLLSQGARIE